MSGRPPLTIVVAASYRDFTYWCGHVADPARDPKDRSLVALVGAHSTRRLHALRPQEGDVVVRYSEPDGRDLLAVDEVLRPWVWGP